MRITIQCRVCDLLLESGSTRIARIGTVRLTNCPPFNDERDTDADKDEAPNGRHVEMPDTTLEQCGRETAQYEEGPGDPTVERPIASEVDEAGRSKRQEKQRISKRLKSGPERSQEQTRAVHNKKHCHPETHLGWCCAAPSPQQLTAHTIPSRYAAHRQ
jgi:hypothetical protein